MAKKISFALSILAAFLFMALGGGAAQAAHVACGDTITVDTKLDENLDCTGGLAIGANRVTLDLNGFTISGLHFGVGVFNPGYDHVTIKNGAITGFRDGVRADFRAKDLKLEDLVFSNQRFSSIVIINSRDVQITDIFVSLPAGGGIPTSSGHIAEAIRLANVDDATVTNATVDGGFFGVLSIGEPRVSNDLTVEDSFFTDVDTGIFIINNTDARVQNNDIVGTDFHDGCYSGIGVVGEESSHFVHIVDNDITNCGFGIFVNTDLPSTELEIRGNHVYENGDGIYLMRVQDSKIIDNQALVNEWVGIGLVTDSIDNKIRSNEATGNDVVDMFHDPSSTPNQWRFNTCDTSDPFDDDIDCP